ncbi:hypothetical protein NQ318_022996 [Aromia moschata]|uniref:Major facilitator superfamily (MFS) profile domain-containing protein n=1 Tax=Aromia moschata TaxID=1265417 RepID=A0AAV8YBY3_9CUCU|nr:hypothetical protein NQ318_022996 [Aromia moschata]
MFGGALTAERVLEYVGPKWRTFVANMSIAIFFTFAASILPWIAYYLADWKALCFVTSAPLALAILTPWFVPESARIFSYTNQNFFFLLGV